MPATLTPIRTTTITDVGDDSSYEVVKPIRVDIYSEGDKFTAVAPDLGMWAGGYGSTEEEALQDLKGAIDCQQEDHDSSRKEGVPYSDYAKAVRERFDEHLRLKNTQEVA